MGTRYYLAWEVPDHISVPLEALRKTLFRETGCISLRALFPLVPIASTNSLLSSREVSVPPASAREHTWNEIRADASGLHIPCLNPDNLPEVTAPPCRKDTDILPCSGIFLGSQDCASGKTSILQEHFLRKFPQGISFIPKKIIMLSLVYDDSRPWWSSLTYSWEIIKSIR